MLTVQETEGMRRRWRLPANGALHIGRFTESDIRIDDLRVSRHHAVVRAISPMRCEIVNVSKDNVVTVNDVPVPPGGARHLGDNESFKIAVTPFEINWLDDVPIGFSDEPLSLGASMSQPPDSSFTTLLSLSTSQANRELEIYELKRKAEMLAYLCDMSAQMSRMSEIADILQCVTEMTLKTLRVDCCAAILIEEGKELIPVSLRFRDQRAEDDRKRSISRTTVRHAVEKRVVLTANNLLPTMHGRLSDSFITEGIHAVICTPLIGRQDVYGALYVDRRGDSLPFEEIDTQLLGAIAAQAAVGIEAAHARAQAEREAQARALYSRFVETHLIQELLANPDKFKLGGSNQKITVLFSDVRGFSRLAHSARPETVVEMLNILFTESVAEIFKHSGTLDKFIGDGLMALFGAPISTELDAMNAVAAAVGMQTRMTYVNAQLTARNLPNIELGIGINTGEATVGFIGAERRSEYTAIGDTVNVAARVESIARPGQVLITQPTADELGGRFTLSPSWEVQVKNIPDPVRVFSVEYQS